MTLLIPNEDALITGILAPTRIPEVVLQDIWARGEFSQMTFTGTRGERIRILHPGRFDPAVGPDFKQAKLSIDGSIVEGDVEIHFYETDWDAHQHSADKNYDKVILHAVAYRNPKGHTTPYPTLEMLPYLDEGLEELAIRYYLREESSKDHWEVKAAITQLHPEERWAQLQAKAKQRFDYKVSLVQKRIQRNGWHESAHQLVLETLGYPKNKGTFSEIAQKHTYRDTQQTGFPYQSIMSEYADQLIKRGVRPANHPNHRLEQYTQSFRANPKWAETWATLAQETSSSDQRGKLSSSEKSTYAHWKNQLWGDHITGGKADTLMIDALLPMAATLNRNLAWRFWFWGPQGNLASEISQWGQQLVEGITPKVPKCNGTGQGALAWFLELGLKK